MNKKDDLLPIDTGRAEFKKLCDWTQEEALCAFTEWSKKNKIGRKKKDPFSRWMAVQQLKHWREEHRKGNKSAVADGLYLCSLYDLPIPQWLCYAFLSAFRKVRHYHAKSWDDVLGRPYPKGTHLEAKRDRWINSLKLWNTVETIKRENPGISINEEFFEKIGKQFGLGRSVANELYYEAKKRFALVNGG